MGNNKLQVFEDQIGLHPVDTIDADKITSVIKDVLICLDLPLSKAPGQCYDECSTMLGSKSGVANQIKCENPKRLITHCYCHALNLACGDTIKQSVLLKGTLEIAYEIIKLDAALKHIQAVASTNDMNNSPKLKIFSPT